MGKVFVGHDWAEAHHDIELQDDQGKVLPQQCPLPPGECARSVTARDRRSTSDHLAHRGGHRAGDVPGCSVPFLFG